MKNAGTLVVLGLIPVAGALILIGQKRTPSDEEAWPENLRMHVGELFNPPEQEHPDDVLWQKLILDPNSGAPFLTAVDLNPSKGPRPLTGFERWALAPYFPVAADLDAIIYQGTNAPSLGDAPPPRTLWGVTDGDGRIYFPNQARSFLTPWWLSVLAHELYHRAQFRIGATTQDSMSALQRWGYIDSPMEVQARYFQLLALRGMRKRARDFYGQT